MSLLYCGCGHLKQDHARDETKTECKVIWPKKCPCDNFKKDDNGFFSVSEGNQGAQTG
jgi:hypothetical protein